MTDESTGYATENVTAVTQEELDAAFASWGDAVRWAVDAEATCPCVCHRPPPVAEARVR